jgi:hypothetical protein
MKFRLRYQHHVFPLVEGQFVIGRSAECQLSLDDPLVSRRHALLSVSAEGLTVEDLGSRNGVQVNGKRISGVTELADGDTVTVGSQSVTVQSGREARTQTGVQAPTENSDAFALLGNLADKALALGRGDEAERILSAHMANVMEDARAHRPQRAELIEQAARWACRLAVATGKGAWLGYLAELYQLSQRLPPPAMVDELYTILRKVDRVDLAAFRGWVTALRERTAELRPAERFLVSRIEGLERLAASR